MQRKRDIRPPFEVMRGGAPVAGSPVPPSIAPPVESAEGPQPLGTGEGWSRLRHPLVFRLPPGYAVLIGLGIIVLLVIAYSAGYSQGSAAARDQAQQAQANEQVLAGRVGTPSRAGSTPSPTSPSGAPATSSSRPGATQQPAQPAGADPADANIHDDPSLDPRKPGYQYLIIAHCSREEAQRLVAFMRERGGVEAAAVLVHNGRQYVVFVQTAFTSEQTTSNAVRELKLKIFELGKLWASRTYRGPTNLSDAYLALYKPKSD